MEANLYESPYGKIVSMNEKNHQHPAPIYIPANANALSEHIYLQKNIPLALQSNPEEVCGGAHRIGYVYVASYKRPVYRLKLRESQTGKKTATLSGFFILLNGIFVEHEA